MPDDPVTDALNALETPDTPTDGRPFKPSCELAGNTGTIVTGTIEGDDDPDWAKIFRHWNLDPDLWTVEPGSLRVNAWEMPAPDGELRIHRQYKATIRRVSQLTSELTDRILLELADRKPLTRRRQQWIEGSPAWVVCPADWQVGGRGGVEAFTARFHAAMDDLHDRAMQLRRQGVRELVLGFLGDMGEGAFGNFDSQLFEVDLDRRDQTRLVAGFELIMLRELAPLFAKTTAVAVPGNHTRNAESYPTGQHDVADMTSFEWAASLLRYSGEAERWDVRFVAPDKFDGANYARVEAGGSRLLFAHGHQKNQSADKLRVWWREVSFSRWGDADSTDHLITGHRHHTRLEELAADRWMFVCPTLGGDSTWFHDQGGPTSRAGLLHYVTRDASVEQLDIAGSP